MKIKNVLLFYKKSMYKIYFQERPGSFGVKNKSVVKKELERFQKAHDEHYATLEHVELTLKKHKINFKKSYRGQAVNYDAHDLVITVGGDGTFLEAARSANKNMLWGVNSSLSYSVGNFCTGNINNFDEMLERILKKNFKIKKHHRLRIEMDDHKSIDCLNDVLISHSNPAAMNRYILTVGQIKEEQRSSGVWIVTPSGSSGAIHSAGGKKISHTARKIQYQPRELYWGGNWKYRLTGGILSERQSVKVTSLMRQGKIYVDGTHLEVPFPSKPRNKGSR
jgi:NAD+ kinase